MNLWIRSQDKIAMSKFDLLIVEETPTGEYMFIADHYKNFGTYKTRKRALEVLDEIQEAQLGNYHYRCPSNVKVSNNENTIVYEMPRD